MVADAGGLEGRRRLMAQQLPYEILCFASIDNEHTLQSVSSRLRKEALYLSELELEELLFSKLSGGANAEEGRLRLRRLVCGLEGDSQWSMISQQRPLPQREYPHHLIRLLAVAPILDKRASAEASRQAAIDFVNALGYQPQSSFRKKGRMFALGDVYVYVYQLYAPTEATDAIQASYQWMLEVQHTVLFTPPSAQPGKQQQQHSRTLQDTLLGGQAKVDAVKSLLQGLVTLERLEV